MRSHLFIRFHADQQVSWSIFDATGQVIDSAIQVSLDRVPRHSYPPIVLIDGTEVILTQVDIPTKQWQRIIQAVPYTLEEQLVEDIDQLHFAVGKRDPQSGLISVAVMARLRMEHYLQQLNTLGLIPSVMIPDILAVPKPNEGWGILSFDNLALVRTGLYTGFAIESDGLYLALQKALVEFQAHPPQQIVIFSGLTSTIPLVELSDLEVTLVEKNHPQGPCAWFVQGLQANTTAFNLRQGDYRPQNKLTAYLRPWWLTLVLLILWGSLTVVNQIIDYKQLEQQNQRLQQQIEQIYRDTFPQAQRVVNPRVQMEQQLKILRNQSDHSNQSTAFISLLNQISQPLSRTPGFHLQQMDYRQGRLDLQLEVANLQALEYLKQRLSRLGLTVDIQSATSGRQSVESRLRIQGGL